MKVIVAGLGIQGRKRAAIARHDVVATVDPVVPEADYRKIEDIPLDVYDAALVCTPDDAKVELVMHLFGPIPDEPVLWACERFENRAYDYFLIGFPGKRPMIKLEGSLLSWRNSFSMDLIGESGSIHVKSLCKWGPTSLIIRDR